MEVVGGTEVVEIWTGFISSMACNVVWSVVSAMEECILILTKARGKQWMGFLRAE